MSDDDLTAGRTLQELFDVPDRRQDWGGWELDAEIGALFLPLDPANPGWNGDRYWVGLQECVTSSELLDKIMQIASKPWADDHVLGGLLRAVDDVLDPQSTLCSGGQSHRLALQEIRNRIAEVASWPRAR